MKKYQSEKFYFVSEEKVLEKQLEKVRPYMRMSTFNSQTKITLDGKVEYSLCYKISNYKYIDLLDGKVIKKRDADTAKVGEKVITYETSLFKEKKKVDLTEVFEGYNEIIKYTNKQVEKEKKELKELSKKMVKIIKEN